MKEDSAEQHAEKAAQHEEEAARHAQNAAEHELEAAASASLASEHERAAELVLDQTKAHEQEASLVLEQTHANEKETHHLKQEAFQVLALTKAQYNQLKGGTSPPQAAPTDKGTLPGKPPDDRD